MRMLLKVSMPVDKSNAAVKDGTLQKTMQSTMDALKPEAAYFTTIDGKRTALIVFDMKNPSDMPSIAEPLFQNLEAGVSLTPVMNADDLQAGLKQAGR